MTSLMESLGKKTIGFPRGQMKNVLCMVLLLFSTAASDSQSRPWAPYVKEIRAIVGSAGVLASVSYDIHYCLYIGNEETNRIDQETAMVHAQQSVRLLHPVPEAAARMSPPSPHRWYAIYQDGAARTTTTALLQENTWNGVPAPLRHALAALGVDDPDLLLISGQLLSGSISVYYAPSHDKDRAFYEEKLRKLLKYMEGNDLQKDLPIQNVIHIDRDAA
jgi:hypothetical protein